MNTVHVEREKRYDGAHTPVECSLTIAYTMHRDYLITHWVTLPHP